MYLKLMVNNSKHLITLAIVCTCMWYHKIVRSSTHLSSIFLGKPRKYHCHEDVACDSFGAKRHGRGVVEAVSPERQGQAHCHAVATTWATAGLMW